MDKQGTVSRHVDQAPDVVFRAITDLDRLPEWNRRMTGVVEVPSELKVGAEWVVSIKLPGTDFNSRSVVLELDRERHRFVHRSKPDDDNPSHTVWTWEVRPEGAGSRVSLSWDLRPATWGRRWFAAPIRSWQIPRDDVPASLAALARQCGTAGRQSQDR
jgi:uncharacterized protein YndB with AHSA1/START domain